MESTKLLPLEFSVFRARIDVAASGTRSAALLGDGCRVLAAVSGGADSIAMLHVLAKLQKRWGFYLEAAYVHHGVSKTEATNRYRDRAARKVAQIATSLGVPQVRLEAEFRKSSQKNEHKPGESEEHLRDGRFRALANHAKHGKFDVIAIGHHADDLLETRLIRLIRGTGPQGLEAMQTLGKMPMGPGSLWRPLLNSSRGDIESYLAGKGLARGKDWLEDPSNRDARYLRNGIRRKLLPMIEKLRPGGKAALARSLALLAEAIGEETGTSSSVLDRVKLMSLSPSQRRDCLAKWLRSQNQRGISMSHVEEILKRIDTPRKRLTFDVAGRVWLIEDASITIQN